MANIKACPFCGKSAEYWEDSQYQDRHVIECMSCGAHKRSEYGYDDVLSDWNRRFDGSGREIDEVAAVHYLPTIVARLGYKEDGQYQDVMVWTGPAFDSSAAAKDEAEHMASQVQIITSIQMTKGTV